MAGWKIHLLKMYFLLKMGISIAMLVFRSVPPPKKKHTHTHTVFPTKSLGLCYALMLAFEFRGLTWCWRQWFTDHCHVWFLGGKWRSASSSDGILTKMINTGWCDASSDGRSFPTSFNLNTLDRFRNEGIAEKKWLPKFRFSKHILFWREQYLRNYHDLIFYVSTSTILQSLLNISAICPCPWLNHANLTVDPHRNHGNHGSVFKFLLWWIWVKGIV